MNPIPTVSEPVGPIEKLLLLLERAPLHAIYRVAIGLLLVPVFQRLVGHNGSTLHFLFFFVTVLVLLRVVPLFLRKRLPFSKAVQAAWFSRRMLSKQYDSYQWRKLFWIGIGLALHTALFGDFRSASGALASVCLVGGATGLLVWRRLGIDKQATDL